MYPFDKKLAWKNVSKLKTVKFMSGDIMLIYEIWNQTDYQYTAYQVLDPFAGPKIAETKICHPIRLHKTDSVILNGDGDVQIIEATNGFVNIYTIAESFDPNKSEDDQAKRTVIYSISLVIASIFVLI